jgi:hypothetical protein
MLRVVNSNGFSFSSGTSQFKRLSDLGCKQRIRAAINDRAALNPMAE